MRNQLVCNIENLHGRAVVFLEPHNLCAEALLEMQDIIDIRAAPTIDGLVIIAHNADVFVRHKQAIEQFVLQLVCVLVFIDHDVAIA